MRVRGGNVKEEYRGEKGNEIKGIYFQTRLDDSINRFIIKLMITI